MTKNLNNKESGTEWKLSNPIIPFCSEVQFKNIMGGDGDFGFLQNVVEGFMKVPSHTFDNQISIKRSCMVLKVIDASYSSLIKVEIDNIPKVEMEIETNYDTDENMIFARYVVRILPEGNSKDKWEEWTFFKGGRNLSGEDGFHEQYVIANVKDPTDIYGPRGIHYVNLDFINQMNKDDFDERIIPFIKLLAAKDVQDLLDTVEEYPELENVGTRMLDFSNSSKGIELYNQEIATKQYEAFLRQEVKEAKEKIRKTAKALLDNNIDIDIIMNATGLSKKEIENLK